MTNNKRHTNLITITALSVVLIYQFINLQNFHWFSFNGFWIKTKFEFKIWNQSFKFRLTTEDPPVGFSYPDAGSEVLAGAGYVARYAVGSTPDWIFKENSVYFLKSEIPFQFAEYRKQIENRFVSVLKELEYKTKAKGVELVLVPVPTKIAIERTYGAKKLPRYELWKPELLSEKVLNGSENPYFVYKIISEHFKKISVDLMNLYQNDSNPYKEHYFVPTDSHWSSYGTALAAKAVVDHLIKSGWSLSPASLIRSSKKEAIINGDLIKAFQLPETVVKKIPSLVYEEQMYLISEATQNRSEKRIIVVGSSYCERNHNTAFGFGSLLAKSLKRKYIYACMAGGGFQTSLEDLNKKGFSFQKGDLLVAELPIRLPPNENSHVPDLN